MRRHLAAAGWSAATCASGIGLLATSGWLITTASLRPPVLSLCVAIGLVQAFSLGRGLARYLQRLAVHRNALGVLAAQRLRLFDRLEPLVPGWSGAPAAGGPAGRPQGEVLTGFLSDAEAVADAAATRATAGSDVAATVALGGALASAVTARAGALLLAGALATVVLSMATHRIGRSTAAREAAARASLAGQVMEAVRSAHDLVALGREDVVTQQLAATEAAARRDGRRAAAVTGLARATATWAGGATTVAVVGAGLTAHRTGHLSGVLLAVLAFVALAVADQLAALPHALAAMATGAAAAARIGALAAVEPPASEPTSGTEVGPGPLGAALEQAEVRAGGSPLLAGASLAVAPSRRVALVGPSGSGKTSAVHALLHFLDCERGRATLGGVDVRALRRTVLARHTAWLPEHAYLFAASVGDNVRIGRPSATDAECTAALRRVGLDRWLATLPEGLATRLGDGGRPVSAGERQRIGMARALLAADRVLFLDEPTAHLDRGTASTVLSDLLSSAGDRAVLVVSHEPGIEDLVDEVVAMDRGHTSLRRPGRRRDAAGSGDDLPQPAGRPLVAG